MGQLTTDMLATLPIWFVAFLFSSTCHEAAHALVAKWGGDLTAYEGGQVSLDPIPHIRREPMGMIVVPILSFFLQGGGWMIGWASAPYDPYWADRHPKRAALMALAGPAANLILVLLAAIIIHVGFQVGFFAEAGRVNIEHVVALPDGGDNWLTIFISILFSLNTFLLFLNLLPVPPLDGHSALPLLLSDRLGHKWRGLWRDGTSNIVGLLVAWILFSRLAGPVWRLALNLLYPGSTWV